VTPDHTNTSCLIGAQSRVQRASRAGAVRRACAAVGVAVALVFVSTAGALLLGVDAAHAAGNPSLDKLILKDPEPGWQSLTASETQQFESEITTELASRSGSGSTYATAVEGWQSPSGADTASLVIFVIQAISGSVGSSASSQATDFCTGATNNTPTSAPAIPNVANSAVTSCSGNGENVTVGSAITGNYLEFIASFGTSPLSPSAIAPVVSDQLSAIESAASSSSTTTSTSTGGTGSASAGSPSPGAAVASSSSTVPTIAGAAGGVVVVAAIVAFVVMRRRKNNLALAGQGQAPPFSTPLSTPLSTPFSAPPAAPSPMAYPSPAQAPSGVGSHDPWEHADPGWLSSHEAAEAAPSPTGPPQAGDAAGGVGHGGGVPGAPGWYEDPNDSTSMRYWDGSNYTGRRRWDGSNWVDA
jgi:Protein of unknown function (DUF2510)